MDIIITRDKIDETTKLFNDLFKNKKFCFVDIETTGLSRQYHKVILIGLLYIYGDEKVVKQYFCDSLSEERKILEDFYNDLKGYDIIVSYNGHSFDIPFLNARFEYNNMDYRIDPFYGFDLYRIIRKNKNTLPLQKSNLKSIEGFLNIHRDDTISGKESIDLYYDYINNRNIESKRRVLLHNLDDLKFLYPVVNILDYLNVHTVYNEFPMIVDETPIGLLKIDKIKKNRDFLILNGSTSEDIEYHGYSNIIDIKLVDKEFNIKLPLVNLTLDDQSKISFLDTSILGFDISSLDSNRRNSYMTTINKDVLYKNIMEYLPHILQKDII